MPEDRLEQRLKALAEQEHDQTERIRQVDLKLYEIANLSPEAARQEILTRLDEELEEEKAIRIKAMIERSSADARRTARHIIAQAI